MRLFVLTEPMCSIRTKPSLVTTSGISRKMSAIVIVRRWWVEHEPPVKLRTALGGVGINWKQSRNYAVAASGTGSVVATLGAGVSVTIFGVSTAAFLTCGCGAFFTIAFGFGAVFFTAFT